MSELHKFHYVFQIIHNTLRSELIKFGNAHGCL